MKIDSRLKNPDKISKAKNNALKKTVFDGSFGEIISIAWAINDGSIECLTRSHKTSETRLMDDFRTKISDGIQTEREDSDNLTYDIRWIGHHIIFDLGFIFKRNKILGVFHLKSMPWPCNSWDRNIRDTMYMWSRREPVSLDVLAYVLLGERKTKTGADVAEMWQNGEIDQIREYNIEDVRKTRKIYKRLA